MGITRIGSLSALLLAGTMVLAGCGSDDNSTPSTQSTSDQSSAQSSTEQSSSTEPAGSSGTSANSGTPAGDLTFDGAGFACATGELRSSGSSAQGKAMGQWITDYNAKCSAEINEYGGGGSGKGRSDFIANQTDFGGTDSAMKEEQLEQAKAERCEGNPAVNLPMVVGPIALAYNLEGVDGLVLDAPVLAAIFNGDVTMWNDPAIAEQNPGLTLPAEAIQSVHRSEDSGTTENFTKYLAAAADGAWPFEAGQAWVAPGGIGAQGSDGVAKAVGTTAGSIGYVEWGFARDSNLAIALIDNGSGAVELTGESAGKAVAAAEIVGEGDDLALQLDYGTDAEGAYPIILVTYQVVCSAANGDNAELLKSFLGYTSTDGQTVLESVGAAPLPPEIQAKVVDVVKTLS